MFIEIPASEMSLKNRKPSYGFGINDSEYMTRITVNGKKYSCPFYSRWQSMLSRCYSTNVHIMHPTYKDCYVCKEWLLFSSFKAWMIKQDWKGKSMDKDIITEGNKIYCPSQCMFVSGKINNLIKSNATSIKHKARIIELLKFENKTVTNAVLSRLNKSISK